MSNYEQFLQDLTEAAKLADEELDNRHVGFDDIEDTDDEVMMEFDSIWEDR